MRPLRKFVNFFYQFQSLSRLILSRCEKVLLLVCVNVEWEDGKGFSHFKQFLAYPSCNFCGAMFLSCLSSSQPKPTCVNLIIFTLACKWTSTTTCKCINPQRLQRGSRFISVTGGAREVPSASACWTCCGCARTREQTLAQSSTCFALHTRNFCHATTLHAQFQVSAKDSPQPNFHQATTSKQLFIDWKNPLNYCLGTLYISMLTKNDAVHYSSCL